MMKTYGLMGIIALVSALSPLSARAEESPQIFLSEINWAGSETSTADEWVEIYNAYEKDVDLSGWLLTGMGSAGDAIAIADGTVLQSHNVLLIANYDLGSTKTTLNIAPQVVTSAVSLPNTALDVALLDAAGNVLDRYTDSGAPDFGGTSPVTSIERDFSDMSWRSALTSVNFTVTTQLGTPGYVETFVPVTTGVIEETNSAPAVPLPVAASTETESISDVTSTEQTTAAPEPDNAIVTEVEPQSVPDIPVENTITVREPAPQPTPTLPPCTSVVLNEIMSDPLDGNEWVELFNEIHFSCDLSGWKLEDASGAKTTVPNIAPASGYFRVMNPAGKLNNAEETVTLKDALGQTVSTVSYTNTTAPKKGRTLSRKQDGSWEETEPTPDRENSFSPPTPTQLSPTYDTQTDLPAAALTHSEATSGTVESSNDDSGTKNPVRVERIVAIATPLKGVDQEHSSESATTPTSQGNAQSSTESIPQVEISDIDTLTENTEVIVQGTIVGEPGFFGKQIAYLNGLELYFYKAEWPKLPLGTEVLVTGTVQKKDGYTRLKIQKAENILVLGTKELTPRDIQSLDDATHGSLVTITGTLRGKEKSSLLLDLDQGETAKVTIAKAVALNTSSLLAGDTITATGVVRIQNGSQALFLRQPADFSVDVTLETPSGNITEAVTLAPPPKHIAWVGGGLMTTSLGALTYWFARAKGISLPFLHT